jgi:hypothetical protein
MRLRLLTFSVFALLALPAVAGAQTFTNVVGTSGTSSTNVDNKPAAIYPSPLSVSGLVGPITDVDVTLTRLYVSDPSYLDFALVAPDGTAVMLMADASTYSPGGQVHLNLVFDQSQPTPVPSFASGPLGTTENQTVFYRPANYDNGSSDAFPSFPAAMNTTADLNRFNGTGPNGEWKLLATHAYSYGYRDYEVAGWSLEIKTAGDTTAPAFSRPAVSGRTIGFDLTEAASVQFRVDRITKGVKVKSRCLAPKKGRKGKRCSRYVALPGAIDTIGVAGINSFAWNGKIGAKKLAPGKYRLTGIARDAAGNQSPPQKFTVTIKKPKKKKKN